MWKSQLLTPYEAPQLLHSNAHVRANAWFPGFFVFSNSFWLCRLRSPV